MVGLTAAALVSFSDNVDAEGNERYGIEVIITVALLGLLMALLGAVIHLWMFTNPERRALHDLVTGIHVANYTAVGQG